MNGDLIKAQDIFLGRVNQTCNKFGLNNIMAQVYALLYLCGKPLSLDDMVERLRISKGSASINIRALERYDVVRKVWVKGSRRDYYEAQVDIEKVVMDRIKSAIQTRLTEVDGMINLSTSALDIVDFSDEEEKEAVEIFRQRLDRLRKLHGKAKELFDLFDTSLLTTALVSETEETAK
ncbi:MAG: hypothetical protein NG740_03645 [Omnitrophica bacterium]|nr:hypothetical protein [Candidatus Omnitrophota bacterium]